MKKLNHLDDYIKILLFVMIKPFSRNNDDGSSLNGSPIIYLTIIAVIVLSSSFAYFAIATNHSKTPEYTVGVNNSKYEEMMMNELEEEGFEIQSAYTQGNVFYLSYIERSRNQSQVYGNIGQVSSAYANISNQSWGRNSAWSADRMEVTIQDSSGRAIGTYRIQEYWAYSSVRGTETDDDYYVKIIAAIMGRNVTEDFPGETRYMGYFNENISNRTGSQITNAERIGDTAFISYQTNAERGDDARNEVTQIATMFAEQIDRGWDPYALDLEVESRDGETIGWYRIRQNWAESYTSGEMDENEYIEHINTTVVEAGTLPDTNVNSD